MKPAAIPVYCLASYPRARPGLAFRVQRLEELVAGFPGAGVPHAHDFYLVLYVVRGRGTHTIDGQSYPVRPGRLFVLAPGQVHTLALAADCRGYAVFFEAGFYLAQFPGAVLHAGPGGVAPPLVRDMAPDERAEVQAALHGLARAYAEPPPGRPAVGRAYLHLLLLLTLPATPAAARPGLDQLRRFEQLLDAHFQTHKSVRAYAGLLHLTANHLNVLCRQRLGKTASQLIHERVVTEARRLLRHSALPVGEVGYALGFDDPSYFGRYFRKYAGQSPEAFRQNR